MQKCDLPGPGALSTLLLRLCTDTDVELGRICVYVICVYVVVEKSQLLAERWLAMLGRRLRSWRSASGGRPARSVRTRCRCGRAGVARKNGSASSCAALGRALGSLHRHSAMTSVNAREYRCTPPVRSSVGGSLFRIFASARAGGSRECGARPCANSSAVIPRLQMSAEESYCFWLITSGAIQHGVPTKLFRLPNSGGGVGAGAEVKVDVGGE